MELDWQDPTWLHLHNTRVEPRGDSERVGIGLELFDSEVGFPRGAPFLFL